MWLSTCLLTVLAVARTDDVPVPLEAMFALVLPVGAGALIGWLRHARAPVETEPGPATVRHYTVTESMAAGAGAGVLLLNLALIGLAQMWWGQLESQPAGAAEAWWEVGIFLFLFGLAGMVLGLIGGVTGGLLAALRHRLRSGGHPPR